MTNKVDKILVITLFALIGLGVGININKQLSVDQSKIPEKVEESSGFQRWITNLKNNDLEQIDADEFRLIEENEIYNTKWLKIYSIENAEKLADFETQAESLKETPMVAFSPSERVFVDYRDIARSGYKPNEAHLYGIRDNNIIDARILDCSERANCYFDRAYFLTNDLLVISEFSRNINKKDKETPLCPVEEECTYSIKLHVIDLINNQRLVYESEPFDVVLAKLKPEL